MSREFSDCLKREQDIRIKPKRKTVFRCTWARSERRLGSWSAVTRFVLSVQTIEEIYEEIAIEGYEQSRKPQPFFPCYVMLFWRVAVSNDIYYLFLKKQIKSSIFFISPHFSNPLRKAISSPYPQKSPKNLQITAKHRFVKLAESFFRLLETRT